VRSLECDPLLMDRVEQLMSIPAMGPITDSPHRQLRRVAGT